MACQLATPPQAVRAPLQQGRDQAQHWRRACCMHWWSRPAPNRQQCSMPAKHVMAGVSTCPDPRLGNRGHSVEQCFWQSLGKITIQQGPGHLLDGHGQVTIALIVKAVLSINSADPAALTCCSAALTYLWPRNSHHMKAPHAVHHINAQISD